MARIAVLHNTLDFQGGADAVCLSACRALQADHEVTLFTISESSLSALAERFEVDLDAVEVRMPKGASVLAGTLSTLAPWIGPQLAFRSALLHRAVRSALRSFDLAVSTANEFSLPIPSVQYVHYPQFDPWVAGRAGDDTGRLNWLWSRLAGPDPGSIDGESTTLLANSHYTAAAVESRYGIRPAVLFPPVDPIPCDGSWDERDAGIVMVGRIAPDKRLLEAISLIDSVRNRGVDAHLHVVGSAPPAYRRYLDRVLAAARDRPYVSVERDVSRERIRELLCKNRVGLNLKEGEPFGMAVAEYVAAGMVPLTPASGGQQEILQERPDLTFESLDGAVDVACQAIEREDPPTLTRERFAADRFRREFRQYVNRTID